jgi:hypothetical protein
MNRNMGQYATQDRVRGKVVISPLTNTFSLNFLKYN